MASSLYEIYDGIRLEAGFDLSFLLAAKAKYEYFDQVEVQKIADEDRRRFGRCGRQLPVVRRLRAA